MNLDQRGIEPLAQLEQFLAGLFLPPASGGGLQHCPVGARSPLWRGYFAWTTAWRRMPDSGLWADGGVLLVSIALCGSSLAAVPVAAIQHLHVLWILD